MGYKTEEFRFDSRRGYTYLLCTIFRPVLGVIQFLILWVPGIIFLNIKLWGVKLENDFHVVAK
jgi:hypothetical protein